MTGLLRLADIYPGLTGEALLRAMLADVYTPEGVRVWLADADKKQMTLTERLNRVEILVTGAFS